MKKEPTRDYAVEMFRAYAAAGYPTAEQVRDRIYKNALAACSDFSGEAAVVDAETKVAEQAAYLMDIAAAEAALRILGAGGQKDAERAVRAVYCASPSRPLRRGDIASRVSRFAILCPASEPQVYRWLRCARLLCAALRGLSISERDCELYHINEKMIVVRSDLML